MRSFPPNINSGTAQMMCEGWGVGGGESLARSFMILSALHLSPRVLRIMSDVTRQRQELGYRGGAGCVRNPERPLGSSDISEGLASPREA